MREKLGAKGLSLQLGLVAILGLIIITGYFTISTYHKQLDTAEKNVLQKLHAIANTLALQLDGSIHEGIIQTYGQKDAISDSQQDQHYYAFHQKLRNAKEKNGLKTDVYTLFFDDKKDIFLGVTSGAPYFRHPYTSYPKALPGLFENGGTLPPFTDDHGTWLSAVAPIKNKAGKTIAVVEVDQNFEEFIAVARKEVWQNVLISLAVFLVITAILVVIGIKIIDVDKEKSDKLQQAHDEVKKQHRQIRESINYARRIQQSIIPNQKLLQQEFPNSFMFYKAKDIVSGDFPWHFKKGKHLYLAAVDCTGHGVPGAMMSFIGYFLLNEINGHKTKLSPAEILDSLHEGVRKTLKQDQDESNARDGMDIALCCLNEETGKMEFAGAHRPLYILKNGELVQVKGDRKAIGGRRLKKESENFTNHVIQLEDKDAVFLFSDGLPDQFGGPDNKKYSPSRIRKSILANKHLSMEEMKNFFETDFKNWKGETDQIDDVLMIGIQV